MTQSGSVIGVDVEPAMVEEAGRRVEDKPWVEVRLGDAHALPVPDESVDRARVDRMVQHVAEFGRVLRPGGLACVAEPDWDSLVIDPGDAGTNRAFTRFVCSTMVGNATVGRQLARLAHGGAAGGVRRGRGRAGVRDFTLADKILGLSRNTERAVRADLLDRVAGERWLAELSAGSFLATSMLFMVVVCRRG